MSNSDQPTSSPDPPDAEANSNPDVVEHQPIASTDHTSPLFIGMVFGSDTKQMTQTIRLIQQQRQKGLIILDSSTTRYVYGCPDTDCPWSVICRRSRCKKFPDQKNPWVLREMNDQHHDLCAATSMSSMKAEAVSSLPQVHSYVSANPKTTLKTLESSLKVDSNNPINLSATRLSKASRYRILSGVRSKVLSEQEETYQFLPSLISEFASSNPGTTCALQLDADGRFFRSFIAPGFAVKAFVDTGSTLLVTDGAHSKSPEYQGVHLFLLFKDGENKNCLVAHSLVPGETTANLVWFIKMCISAGIPVTSCPIFTDRGKMLNAATVLASKGIILNLKYCTEHIYRNVIDKFKIKDEHKAKELHRLIFRLQSSKSFEKYCVILDIITDRFGKQV